MADLISMLAACAGGGEKDPDFNQTVLLLHGDGTNGAQNNTFLDSSTNNFTITRNPATGPNAPTQGTFSPFSGPNGYWSNLFVRASSQYLTVSNPGGEFSFGTGAFTIECWVYLVSMPSSTGYPASYWLFGGGLAVSNTGVDFYINNTQIGFNLADFTSATAIGNHGMSINNWYHVAVVRGGSSNETLSIYVNGTRVATATGVTATADAATSGISISAAEPSGATSGNFDGYISNYRVVKGTAVYDPTQTTLTVPTAPLTAITNTQLLTCQSNRFVDNSTNAFAITRNGDVRVTPFSPFAPTAAYSADVNGGSGYFDGTGDYLSIADAAGLRFGTGNFTIQCWIYRNAAGATHTIAAKGGASTGWVFQVTSGNVLRFTNTTTNIDTTTTIPALSWNHVAVIREGTGTDQVKLYINGVQSALATVSTDFNQTEQLNIGADRGNANAMNGYITGFKYVVGTAETITVPTAPPTGGTALLNFTNAGIIDNTGKNVLETVGNAQIDTTTKKFGTGSLEFDGNGDYLVVPNAPSSRVFGTGDFTWEAWINANTVAAGTRDFFGIYDGGSTGIIVGQSGANIRFFCQTATITSSTTIIANTWYHIAAVRSGTTGTLYINGVSVGSGTIGVPTNTNFSIGRAGSNNGNYFNGFIDDLRITKGVARYPTEPFPTAAFPNE